MGGVNPIVLCHGARVGECGGAQQPSQHRLVCLCVVVRRFGFEFISGSSLPRPDEFHLFHVSLAVTRFLLSACFPI